MAFASSIDQLQAWGLWKRGGLANVYPELARNIRSLVINRIDALPWVPANYAQAYDAFSTQFPGDLMAPTPVISTGGNPVNAADWMDSNAKLNAWQNFAQTVNSAIASYIAGSQIAGARALAQLEADSAFWNTVAGGVDKAGAGIASGAQAAGSGIATGAKAVGTGIGNAYTSIGAGGEALLKGAGRAVEGIGGGIASGVKWVIILAAVGGAIYLYVQYKGVRTMVGGILGGAKAKVGAK